MATPDPSKLNLGLGHTVDCPYFETRFPWKCDCQVKAARGRSHMPRGGAERKANRAQRSQYVRGLQDRSGPATGEFKETDPSSKALPDG